MILYQALIEEEEDKLTFSRIYDLHCDEMIAIAYGVLQNRWDAEDAVQQALMGLAVSIKSVPPEPNMLRAYALASARNAAIQLSVRQSKEKKHIQITGDIASQEDVFDIVADKESYENLISIMKQLPLSYKEVFMLRYVAKLSPQKIAKLLGIKTATVYKQLSRGKKIFISLYKEMLTNNG